LPSIFDDVFPESVKSSRKSPLPPFTFFQVGVRWREIQAVPGPEARALRGKSIGGKTKSLLTERCSCVILVKTAISYRRSAVSQKMGMNQERVFADS